MDAIKPAPLVEPAQENAATQGAGDANGKKRQKVPFAIKRARTNAKMRRTLNPKNSITFLNELRPGELKFELTPVFNMGAQNHGWGFKATVIIDNKPYSGTAKTMTEAKMLASEAALKVIVTAQVKRSQATSGLVAQNPAAEEDDSDSDEEAEEGQPKQKKKRVEEDPFPWGGLGAFAFQRLLKDWKIEANARLPMKKIPADANKKHPVMLLNELIPSLAYREIQQGNWVNGVVFKAFVEYDGKIYEGTGGNKKDAKKQAAKALLATFGVIYNDGNF